MIVLGGGVTQIGPLLLKLAFQIVQEKAMVIPYRDVRIVLAQLGIDAGIVGADPLNFLSGDFRKLNCSSVV